MTAGCTGHRETPKPKMLRSAVSLQVPGLLTNLVSLSPCFMGSLIRDFTPSTLNLKKSKR